MDNLTCEDLACSIAMTYAKNDVTCVLNDGLKLITDLVENLHPQFEILYYWIGDRFCVKVSDKTGRSRSADVTLENLTDLQKG